MENNYIGVYEDTRPEWRRWVEQDLYHYANEYNIPVVVLYDFTRFLEYYLPSDFNYWTRETYAEGFKHVVFENGQITFRCRSLCYPEVLSLTIGQDYGIEVKLEDYVENKLLLRFTISVRNYYNEALKAITKKLFKCPATDVSTSPPPMK